MGRPKFQTLDDLDNERSVIEVWDQKMHCTSHKLPDHYYADYCCVRNNQPVAIVEIKRRNLSWGDFPTFVVGAKKRMECLRLAEYFNIPAFMVFQYNDGVYYANFAEKPLRHEWKGRFRNARDTQDQEPMVFWSDEVFKKL
jgi:hypothetical protein